MAKNFTQSGREGRLSAESREFNRRQNRANGGAWTGGHCVRLRWTGEVISCGQSSDASRCDYNASGNDSHLFSGTLTTDALAGSWSSGADDSFDHEILDR